jgi:hypothetical protein
MYMFLMTVDVNIEYYNHIKCLGITSKTYAFSKG